MIEKITLTFVLLHNILSADIDRATSWSDEKIDSGWKTQSDIEDRGAKSQHDSLIQWRKSILDSDKLTATETYELLGSALLKTSMFNIFQVPERIEVYDLARSKLISIPGHAKYFSDKIERMRRQLEPGPSQAVRWRGDYDRERDRAILTLRHLPSPETIQVLGQYLSDERDTPPPRRPDQDWTDIPANCILSSEALAKIGLRDGPVSKDGDWESPAALAKIRAWWDEVKSGRRTFSFVGQKVEYRFKPDGTWDTLPISNPPDDGPKVSKLAPAAPTGKVATTQPALNRSWLWAVGVIVLMLFGLFRIGSKRMGRNP